MPHDLGSHTTSTAYQVLNLTSSLVEPGQLNASLQVVNERLWRLTLSSLTNDEVRVVMLPGIASDDEKLTNSLVEKTFKIMPTPLPTLQITTDVASPSNSQTMVVELGFSVADPAQGLRTSNWTDFIQIQAITPAGDVLELEPASVTMSSALNATMVVNVSKVSLNSTSFDVIVKNVAGSIQDSRYAAAAEVVSKSSFDFELPRCSVTSMTETENDEEVNPVPCHQHILHSRKSCSLPPTCQQFTWTYCWRRYCSLLSPFLKAWSSRKL